MNKSRLKTILLLLGIISFSSCSFANNISSGDKDSSSSDKVSIINPEINISSEENIESVISSEEISDIKSNEEISSVESSEEIVSLESSLEISSELISSEEVSSSLSISSEKVSSYVSSSGFSVSESGRYTDVESVAMYLVTFHKLPSNYVTKSQASKYDDTYSIGGDYFGNKEGYLPSAYNGSYRECDIGSTQNRRGAKRIVYETRTYRIFYTTDHYSNFREYYGYKSWSELFGKSNDIY